MELMLKFFILVHKLQQKRHFDSWIFKISIFLLDFKTMSHFNLVYFKCVLILLVNRHTQNYVTNLLKKKNKGIDQIVVF